MSDCLPVSNAQEGDHASTAASANAVDHRDVLYGPVPSRLAVHVFLLRVGAEVQEPGYIVGLVVENVAHTIGIMHVLSSASTHVQVTDDLAVMLSLCDCCPQCGTACLCPRTRARRARWARRCGWPSTVGGSRQCRPIVGQLRITSAAEPSVYMEHTCVQIEDKYVHTRLQLFMCITYKHAHAMLGSNVCGLILRP